MSHSWMVHMSRLTKQFYPFPTSSLLFSQYRSPSTMDHRHVILWKYLFTPLHVSTCLAFWHILLSYLGRTSSICLGIEILCICLPVHVHDHSLVRTRVHTSACVSFFWCEGWPRMDAARFSTCMSLKKSPWWQQQLYHVLNHIVCLKKWIITFGGSCFERPALKLTTMTLAIHV